MYHVKQMQGLDYILKSITNIEQANFYNKKIQLVVDIDSKLWRGDFLVRDNGTVLQRDYTSSTGRSEINEYYPSDDTPILMEAEKAYRYTLPQYDYLPNPYIGMTDLHILYYHLIKALNKMNVDEDTKSNFYSYLYNAVSLDGTIELPFLDVSGKKIDLVSIVEVKE